jgi:hypothetical protein
MAAARSSSGVCSFGRSTGLVRSDGGKRRRRRMGREEVQVTESLGLTPSGLGPRRDRRRGKELMHGRGREHQRRRRDLYG